MCYLQISNQTAQKRIILEEFYNLRETSGRQQHESNRLLSRILLPVLLPISSYWIECRTITRIFEWSHVQWCELDRRRKRVEWLGWNSRCRDTRFAGYKHYNNTTSGLGLDRRSRKSTCGMICELCESTPCGYQGYWLGLGRYLVQSLTMDSRSRSVEKKWWVTHNNGRTEGPFKPQFIYEQIYLAAYIMTFGEVALYYPPLQRLVGHPFVFSQVLGTDYSSRQQDIMQSNRPGGSIQRRRAYIGPPYPDAANPGLAILTAMAPVYYTGNWQNYTYNDTYLGLVGIDVSVAAFSVNLQHIEGTQPAGSFACIIDADFEMYIYFAKYRRQDLSCMDRRGRKSSDGRLGRGRDYRGQTQPNLYGQRHDTTKTTVGSKFPSKTHRRGAAGRVT